jgi:hypothetical protein
MPMPGKQTTCTIMGCEQVLDTKPDERITQTVASDLPEAAAPGRCI